MNKLKAILQTNKQVFHIEDLGLIWGITNKNTLHVSVKRLLASGILFPIRRGFYSTIDPYQLDPILLGSLYLRQFNYVSTETILAKEGLLFQSINAITLIASESRTFELLGQKYLVRQMKDSRLYNSSGLELNRLGYYSANKLRALSDMYYYQNDYYVDAVKNKLQEEAKVFNKKLI